MKSESAPAERARDTGLGRRIVKDTFAESDIVEVESKHISTKSLSIVEPAYVMVTGVTRVTIGLTALFSAAWLVV